MLLLKRLKSNFYSKDTLYVAKNLLGKILVHEIDGKKLSGRIVETEAYRGINDKAAHSYMNKRTKRTEVMYGPCGFSYVFMIYGMYHCFNVVTGDEGVPEAVLIRALEPLNCIDEISFNRYKKKLNQLNKNQIKNLTNGPGKLCKGLLIGKEQNKKNLYTSNIYIENDNFKDFNMKSSKRIGINYAEEAADYLWRFYMEDNAYVSVK